MNHSHPEALLDDSDYGDFGSDGEELEVLQRLVDDAEGDIEEAPRMLLPKIPGLRAHLREGIYYDTEKRQRRSTQPIEPPVPEHRSPLERFRKPPRKGFSVTDLVSPAWCELQYYYSLLEPRKKRRTAAMKKGTAVHKALEDEVHTTVPVEIIKKEDKWGLRIWNIIQGLRTLRETGRTRELEVWGTVHGEIVNGIIDELSYECPNPKPENVPTDNEASMSQTTIVDLLRHDNKAANETERNQKIYITDVKTRGSPTLPTGARIRPTILQLHLYHYLLENMVLGNVDIRQLAERYSFDAYQTFSGSFIAQIGSLNQEVFEISSSQEQKDNQPIATEDSINVLLAHSSPASLWEYLMGELRLTFIPPVAHNSSGESSETSHNTNAATRLSNTLTAEYVAPTYKHIGGFTKKSIGKKSFGFNAAYLRSYLEDSLSWWHGQREAKGVKLEDAWKCRHCDFRDDCSWIHERDAATLQEVLEKKKLRAIAGVNSRSNESSKS